MTTYQGQIIYGGESLTYTLTQKRVKNINLRIHPDGSLHLSASPYVPLTRIESFIIEQMPFIKRAQAKFKSIVVNQGSPRLYVTGEKTTILGKEVHLQVEVLQRSGSAYGAFDGKDTLYLFVKDPTSKDQRFKAFDSYLRSLGERVFKAWSKRVYERFRQRGYEVPLAKLRQRRMTSRWGSCTPAKELINMNTRLIEGPESFIEYVMVHEYAHFVHANHSKAFHTVVAHFLPDWKARKKALNTYFYLHGN